MALQISAPSSSIDPLLPPPTVVTLSQATGIVLLPQRAAAWITGGLGMVRAAAGDGRPLRNHRLLRAARRTREIGVRVALGAQRRDVLALIVREGLWLAVTGVACGLALAAGATRIIASLLFSVSPLDVATFAGMSAFDWRRARGVLSPARRAAETDPVVALRGD